MPEGRQVAGLVVPTPAYVRFAAHYGFRPDFCEGADPESKGLVENLVGYVKSDLMIPEELSVANLARDNELGLAWCDEVNAVVHSEICAIPAERLTKELEVMGTLPSLRATIGKLVVRKVDRLSCVRFGSARYSVPTIHIGRQVELVAQDGQVLIILARSSPPTTSSPLVRRRFSTSTMAGPGPCPPGRCGPRPPPRRPSAVSDRRRSPSSRGRPLGHDFAQRRSRRAGSARSGPWQRGAGGRTRTPATSFGRFRAHDVRSIIAAGTGVPRPAAPGDALIVELPLVPTRSLSDYAIGERS